MNHSYRDLRVWQKAMQLVLLLYRETSHFPKDEIYGLTSQMRRAAVSIPSNVAEGKGRSSDKDRNVFFCHSRGSLLELETQIAIATELGYLDHQQSERLLGLCGETGRMLNALIQSIKPTTKTAS